MGARKSAAVTLGFSAGLANPAIAGGHRLGAALENHPQEIPVALREWESQLRPKAEAKQKLGRQVKGLYAPVDPIRLWIRDAPLRLAALRPVSWFLQRRLQLDQPPRPATTAAGNKHR